MANLFKGVVKLTEAQYETLKNNKVLIVGDTTITFDEHTLYVTDYAIDTELDLNSPNPVENRVIAKALEEKANAGDIPVNVVTTDEAQEISGDKNFSGVLKYKTNEVAVKQEIPIVSDDLNTEHSANALSVNQGIILNNKITTLVENVNGRVKSFTVNNLEGLGMLFDIEITEPLDVYDVTKSTIAYKEKEYDLVTGDIFFVVSSDVPDYWFSLDDMRLYKMETMKVDLSNFYTIEQTDNLLKNKADKEELPTEEQLIQTLESPIRIWDLDEGIYRLPENCTVYYKGATNDGTFTIDESSILQMTYSSSKLEKGFVIIGQTGKFYCGSTTESGGSFGMNYLTSIPKISPSDTKGYIVGAMGTSWLGTSYANENCYMENGKLFSEGKEVALKEGLEKIISDIPKKTSVLENDGDGNSAFATEEYVNDNGGKIDKIFLNDVEQEIVNKEVHLTVELPEYEQITDYYKITNKLTGIDLNTIVIPGNYGVANDCIHTPVAENGTLFVGLYQNNQYAQQMFISASNNVYVRTSTSIDNSTWNSWVKLAQTEELSRYLKYGTNEAPNADENGFTFLTTLKDINGNEAGIFALTAIEKPEQTGVSTNGVGLNLVTSNGNHSYLNIIDSPSNQAIVLMSDGLIGKHTAEGESYSIYLPDKDGTLATLEDIPESPVQSVNNKTGNVVLNKADIGLSNVDNTSDLDKPISSAMQNALNLKEDKANLGDLAYKDSLSKSEVGLENVDNTSDLDKPISSATQKALDLKVDFDDIADFITKDVNNLTNYTLSTGVGTTIDLSVDTTNYKITAQLKNSSGTVLSSDEVDLPLESVVVSGKYDSTNKKVVLTLQNGSTISFSVADLVSGLVNQSALDTTNANVTNLTTRVSTNETNITNLQNDKANTSDLNNYLPLTAGEEKTITGNLYVKNSSGNGNIIVGNGSCLLGASTGNLAISPKAGGIIYLRPQGSTISTGALAIKNGVVYPAINNQVSLGDSSYTFNNIYGTTIYQNGKQVANKEDIPSVPTVNNGTLTIQKNGTSVGTFTANQSSDSTINIEVPTGAAADKGVVTTIDTSVNLPTSNAVKTFVEGKGYITSSGSITGNAATATKATQDGSGNVITTTYAKISDLANYLPLTAGSDKKLTGNLYLTKDTVISNLIHIRGLDSSGNAKSLIALSNTNNVWVNYDNSGATIVGGSALQPFTANHQKTNLGTATASFNNIYGKTIYQNGKQVANKEDIPTDLVTYVDDIPTDSTPDPLANYLPLIAGSGSPITGDLYIKNGTAEKNVYIGNGGQLRVNSSGDIVLSSAAGRGIYLRPQGSTTNSGGITFSPGAFSPSQTGTNGVSLGTSSLPFVNIYGTTIYQNGVKVATVDDLANFSGGNTITVQDDVLIIE